MQFYQRRKDWIDALRAIDPIGCVWSSGTVVCSFFTYTGPIRLPLFKSLGYLNKKNRIIGESECFGCDSITL